MTKKKLYLIVWAVNTFILIIGLIAYFQTQEEITLKKTLTEETIFADTTWPSGTMFEVDSGGDLTLISNVMIKGFSGKWESGTKFKLIGNNLRSIDANDDFEFAEINFETPAIIEFREGTNYSEVFIQFKREIQVDGLDLGPECRIFFKNEILNSAICPDKKELFFKRRIELPEFKFNI
jgi:hypothetical protein